MGNNDCVNRPQPKSGEPLERRVVEELASVDKDVGGTGRRSVAQEDGGVAPPVPVPRLGRLGANRAGLGGMGEAADARDALAGARPEEDELRLPLLLLLHRRGRDRAAGGEGARGVEAQGGEAGRERRGGRWGAEEREVRAHGARRGERARAQRQRHGEAVGAQESRDRAHGGAGHWRREEVSDWPTAAAGQSGTTGLGAC